MILILVFASGIFSPGLILYYKILFHPLQKFSKNSTVDLCQAQAAAHVSRICSLRAQRDTLSFFSHRATTLKPQLPPNCCATAFKTCPTPTAQNTAGMELDTTGCWIPALIARFCSKTPHQTPDLHVLASRSSAYDVTPYRASALGVSRV